MILYTTETCARCPIVKKKLDEAEIAYKVNQNIEEMQDLGIRTVPMAKVDGELLDFGGILKYIKERTDR